jgi:glycerate 2-kinase
MQVLIAPNAFKNAVSARQAAEAIRDGLISTFPRCAISCFPIGDGGDGTALLIVEYCKGIRIDVQVHDPLDRSIIASYGLINEGNTAVIEMADASGLRLLKKDELDPLHTSSFGTGEMIIDAMNRGVRKIIIGMGGSATVDGGAGILRALGVRFLNGEGRPLTDLPKDLHALVDIDSSKMDRRCLNTEIIVLCDVENPLLGEQGAANVFGPQKGASTESVYQMEKGLRKFNEVTFQTTGKRIDELARGGTAGGAAAGLYAFLNANLVNGIAYFLDLTNFDQLLLNCNLVITGEGSIDRQTLGGKGPFGVAVKAKERGIPVIGLAGVVPAERDPQLQMYFDILLAIGHKPTNLNDALTQTEENLKRMGSVIGTFLSLDCKD